MQKKSLDFYNYTIIGAGASGLWMAYSLLKHGLLNDKSLIIVEEDTDKSNDRTWCYWSKEILEQNDFASKSWSHSANAQNSFSGGSIHPYTYYHIRSQDFYDKMKAELSKSDNVTWLYSSFLASEVFENVSITTSNRNWTTERAFLSALPKYQSPLQSDSIKTYLNNYNKQPILLWQSFVGWRIKTEKPAFDHSKMTMMDFSIEQSSHTQFMYELPFSETESLVEMTRFGSEKLSSAEAESILKKYIAKKNTDFKIEETEIGAIPMTTHFDSKRESLPTNEKVIYLGTIAGAIKPTTGYGFKRMAKYANALAIALKQNEPLPTHYRPWRFRVYDTLLLQILESKGEKGKEIFEALFKTQPTPKILKFLDEESTIFEEISIFSKLPILLFLKSLVKYIFK